jgi:uncharacterized protein (UPF0335 family)
MAKRGSNSASYVRSYVERLEKLDEDVQAINRERADQYRMAKDSGIDPKALKQVMRRRRMDPEQREGLDAAVDMYERMLKEEEPDGGADAED